MTREGRPLWLLGTDVSQSASPAMHNAGLAALGLAPLYEARPLRRHELDAVLDDAEDRCAGLNVTHPFKTRVAERYAAVLDDVARETGAVNTVCFREGGVFATNTDVHGLKEAWRRASVNLLGRTAAVVGAGGAARATVVALQEAGAERVVVYARRQEAALELVALARRGGLRAEVADDEPKASVAVFAVPSLDDEERWVRRVLQTPGVVHDLRYGGAGRALRNAALRAGHLYVDGAPMLLAQARASLAAFLGEPTLPQTAARAMEQALARALR